MVQRTSTPVEINGQQTGQVLQAQGGYVRPDVNGFLTREVDSGRDRILQGILGEIESTARKGHQRSLESAYLEGAAKVGQIQSEAEIEGDIFTRDWAVAGYRDTNARFAMADTEATIAKDMAWLRQESPERFNSYLAEKRRDIMPQLEGMSREAREAAFKQLLTSERAAIKTHASEHQKWQIEVKQQSWASKTATTMSAMDLARGRDGRGDPTAYGAAVDAGYAHAAAIWSTPEFDDAKRRDLTVQFAEHALASDNIQMYERLRDLQVEGVSMLGRLTPDQQEKLAGKYREAKQRNAFEQNTAYVQQHAQLMAAFEAGEVPVTESELIARLNAGVTRGVVSQGMYDSTLQSFYKARARQGTDNLLADAYLTNRTDQILLHGDEAKAEAAVKRQFQKAGTPLNEQVRQLTSAGMMGNVPAFKVAGSIYDRSIGALSNPDGTVNMEHARVFAQLDTTLTALEQDGERGAVGSTNILAGMSEANGMRVRRIRALTASGMSTDAAIAEALKAEVKDSSMTVQQRAEVAGMRAQEDAKFLRKVEEDGWFRNAGLWVRSLFGSAEAQALQTTTVSSDLPPKVRGEYLNSVKTALVEEFNHVDLASSNLSQDDRLREATARLQRRIVHTDNGPFIVPKGKTVQAYFGLADSIPAGSVGTALNTVTKPSIAGHKNVLRDVGGRLQMQQYDEDGNPSSAIQYLDKSALSAQIDADNRKEAERLKVTFGDGKTVQPRGAKLGVQYNGTNAAGVDESLMLQLRDNLVNNEGVKDTPYDDLSGKVVNGKKVQTVGVGVSSHNRHYPESAKGGRSISQDELNQSFRGASNDAAVAGERVRQSLGLNDSGFLLASELAYQSGTAFDKTSGYTEFMRALAAKDEKAAIATFQRTPAYKHSGPMRRWHYETLIVKTMKG